MNESRETPSKVALTMGHWLVVWLHRRCGLFGRQRDDRAEADVDVQLSAFHKDAAPDDLAGAADSFERAAAEREIHGRLAVAGCAAIAIDKVAGGSGAGDLQHPDEVVDAVAFVVLAPADVVQRGCGIELKRLPRSGW